MQNITGNIQTAAGKTITEETEISEECLKAVGIPKRHRRSSSLDAGLIELEYNHESIDVSELKRFQINGFRKPCVLMKSLTGGKHVITLSNVTPHVIIPFNNIPKRSLIYYF